MGDDIVTTLRLSCISLTVDGVACHASRYPTACPLCRAADEIDTLRAELAVRDALMIVSQASSRAHHPTNRRHDAG